jgi:hypothetical protein
MFENGDGGPAPSGVKNLSAYSGAYAVIVENKRCIFLKNTKLNLDSCNPVNQ